MDYDAKAYRKKKKKPFYSTMTNKIKAIYDKQLEILRIKRTFVPLSLTW
jgi:hypothetical protein